MPNSVGTAHNSSENIQSNMATQDGSTDSTATVESNTTVLFVDDEPDLLELYEALCSAEYDVLTATSGEDALETFGPHVDFVFLDRRMPGMLGEEALQELRDRGYGTPVCLLSAVEPETEPDVEHEEYITKPVDRQELLDTIARHT